MARAVEGTTVVFCEAQCARPKLPNWRRYWHYFNPTAESGEMVDNLSRFQAEDCVRTLALLCFVLTACCRLQAVESCMTFHGRAHFYGGDGQLRIWHIGTHHEYEPDNSSWDTVMKWLEEGVKPSERQNYAAPASAVNLFADFLVCPTEPFKKGAVQEATVKSALHRHYVPVH